MSSGAAMNSIESLAHQLGDRIWIWSIAFCEGRKTGEPCWTALLARARTNNKLNLLCRQVQDSNSGQIGGLRISHQCANPVPQKGHLRVVFFLCFKTNLSAIHSYENEFCLQGYFLASETHFLAKALAFRLVLKQRHEMTLQGLLTD